MKILYKPGPQLFIVDWLSRYNHNESKDEEIPGMTLNINVVDIYANILECIMAILVYCRLPHHVSGKRVEGFNVNNHMKISIIFCRI